ncbi:MAG: calcium/sodium antiporter [Oscillospiraceae bacterium]|nr:calcium/sodium antiporter [Oscillospiraceae bacterium]
MLITVLLFLLGFLCLIKGGDWFVDGATGIARRFHLPDLLIGATVVSIGTTLPEVMISTEAAFQGNAGISYGNAIGSVICNTCLIAAATIAVKPGQASRKSLTLPTVFFFLSASLYTVIAAARGVFVRLHGVLFLVLFLAYLLTIILQMKKDPEATDAEEPAAKNLPLWKELLRLVVGAALIAAGADLLINNGTVIARAIGVPDSVIGLTIIALGTSLPELITAITASAKGHSALGLGNVIGANFLNIALVSGAAITISPFAIPAEKTLAGINSSLIVDIPLMIVSMILLCIPALFKEKLERWQGILLLILYGVFTAYQFFL